MLNKFEERIESFKKYERGWLTDKQVISKKQLKGECVNENSIKTMYILNEKIHFYENDFGIFMTEEGNIVAESDKYDIKALANGNVTYFYNGTYVENITIEEFFKLYFYN